MNSLKRCKVECQADNCSRRSSAGWIQKILPQVTTNTIINEKKVLTYSIEDFHESVDKARINATQVKLRFAPDGTGTQDRINFSILADEIRIKQDTVDITLSKFQLDGYALLHEKEDKLDLHIPSQGAVQQIAKAFLRV